MGKIEKKKESVSGTQPPFHHIQESRFEKKLDLTFISLIRFPEIDDSNWFEVEIPQPDAAISAPGGEALFTGIHAENP